MKKINIWVGLIVFLLFSVSDVVNAYVVTGRVLIGDNVNNNAYVYFKTSGKAIKTDVDKTGFFKIELEKGTYLVTADAMIENKLYKGFSGRNPIYIDKDEHIGIKLLRANKIKILKNSKSYAPIIQGRLLYNGKPVKDARVYLYMNLYDFKGMPYYYSLPTDKLGRFKISDVIEGSYFVVAKKKNDNQPLGPLMEGDLIGFLSDESYNFKGGYIYKFDINMFQKMKDEPPATLPAEGEVYYVRGKAVDKSGNPVEGLYAFAYDKKVIGHERPVSISKRTDKAGNFVLPLPKKGKYYIGVREFYGGTPVQGEYYGLYPETYDHHLNVDKDVNNVVIAVEKILK